MTIILNLVSRTGVHIVGSYAITILSFLDPDMLYRDGIYTGRYMPPADGFYNISVSLERISPPTTAAKASAELINDPFRYAIPIDQCNIFSS